MPPEMTVECKNVVFVQNECFDLRFENEYLENKLLNSLERVVVVENKVCWIHWRGIVGMES